MRGLWLDFRRGLAELIFPPAPVCAVCDRDAAGPRLGLCRECLGRLPMLGPPLCGSCGRMLRLCAAADGTCRECARERFYFSHARAACLYDGAARSYLHEVKFGRSLPLARALADVLAQFVREERCFGGYDAIVPVPLHYAKEAERGFNQAEIMAQAVGGVLRRSVLREVLIRTRRTEAQNRLDRNRRRTNVHGAFKVVEPACLQGRKILLVDDILTTGYTVSECARMLLRAGARVVDVLTLANGVIENDWFGT
ncbi:MAG: ComF family protein [Patescibacteria group bacterium]